jgi:uncharacterized protein YjbI with pentapeptide repeats
VPAILILVVSLWNSSQTARDNHRADQQRQDTTLDSYLKQMSDLMLNDKLLTSADGSAVREVATAVTNATLPRLDGERATEVVRFLSDARASLDFLELPGQDLADQTLFRAYLYGANLAGADLTGAYLYGANLQAAGLQHARLKGAILGSARLSGALLLNADLSGAFLQSADLRGANLTGANLQGAKLAGALFSNTTCPNGKVTNTGC